MSQVTDYDYHLPDELIAQFPPPERTGSRLLKVSQEEEFLDLQLPDIVEELRSGDLLVLNDTKVIPARLYGAKDSGGKIELLLERVVSPTSVLAQIKSSRAPKIGQALVFPCDADAEVRVLGRERTFFELEFKVAQPLVEWFELHGHMPLPPYIVRNDESSDIERYQTVFAEKFGAVAAPTAGLHFDNELLRKILAKGVDIKKVTLHVGAGTYQPVRVTDLEDHQMHTEWLRVSKEVCQAVNDTKARGGAICAVGTTVVRALESAARQSTKGKLEPFSGDTDIFIYPGFDFKIVDKLLTNFHLPQSTLLMLVSAFLDRKTIMSAYQHAIANKYRFFSYGDAMLLSRDKMIT